MERYDVVIAGAGTAGSVAAREAASRGAKVLLIESKTPERIGEKVCGDAIGAHHFDASGVPRPPREIIKSYVKAILVYSPSGRHSFRVEGEGYALKRLEWGRWLVRMAEDAGAELRHSTKATKPILEDGRVVGVRAVNSNSGESYTFYGRVVIDASGWTGVIRRALPEGRGVEPMPRSRDVAVCYREVRRVRRPIEDPEIARIYLDESLAPGGYWWLFPQGEGQVNIGLGLQGGSGLDPKSAFMKRLAGLDLLGGSELLNCGGGVVPTRRSMHTLVGYGAMFIGDAGFTANPIHGGGIGSSMRAGAIAGRVAVDSLSEEGDVDSALWRLNKEYNRAYGMKAAGLDIFRLLLQSLSNEDIEFGMERRLITESDLSRVSYGDTRLPVREKALRLIRGVGRPTVLRHLAATAEYMRRVRRLYADYPDAEDFPRWSESVDKVFKEFQAKILPSTGL